MGRHAAGPPPAAAAGNEASAGGAGRRAAAPPTQWPRRWVVYLLSAFARTTGREQLYIGFTDALLRRVSEHNEPAPGGKRPTGARGARRTARHQPWRVLLYVEGFETKKEAQRFEAIWQRPERSGDGFLLDVQAVRFAPRAPEHRRGFEETLELLGQLRMRWPRGGFLRVRSGDGANAALALGPLTGPSRTAAAMHAEGVAAPP